MLIAFTSLSCIKSQMPNPNGPLFGTFINLGFKALDIGSGSEGDMCIVAIDRLVYCYDMMDDDWTRISTIELVNIIRLDVNDDGDIYVISACGIYYLDCQNRWIKLPGGATDIGVGVDFTVWKVGNDRWKLAPGDPDELINYGIWKLICDCECLCICRRLCMRFRLRHYDPCQVAKPVFCYWFRTDGYGINIDVMPNGDAVYSVNHTDQTYSTLKIINHHGNYNRDYLCGGVIFPELAGDVTVGNTGVVYATDITTGDVWKCHRNATWFKVQLKGVAAYKTGVSCLAHDLFAERITASSYNQLHFVHSHLYFDKPSSEHASCNNRKRRAVYTGSRHEYINGVAKNELIVQKKLSPGGTPAGTAPK